jgi:hypothetical protein
MPIKMEDFSPSQRARMTIQPSKGQKADTPKEAKPSKYRNVKTVVDGIVFDSKREAQYWHELTLREKAGDITGLMRQVEYGLACPVQYRLPEGEENLPALVSTYRADFVYTDKCGVKHIVDAKGKRTAMYILKAKWMLLQYGVTVEEV